MYKDERREEIDFVVLWVDGNDPIWRAEKDMHLQRLGYKTDNRNARYRDWNNMMYWFRAVEKFAPWVRKVHFVTFGHLPPWLNVNCPKLNIVRHDEFIPSEYLPLFNSSAIEINIHRIKDLSEKFIYFNDDMFLIDSVKKDDFFVKDCPVTYACFVKELSEKRRDEDPYFGMIATNAEVVSKNYKKYKAILMHPLKFFSLKNRRETLCNIRALFNKSYVLDSTHMPQAFTKEVFFKAWDLNKENMIATSMSRFRRKDNVNQDLMKSHQILSGNFSPQSREIGMPLFFSNEELLRDVIVHQSYKMCCIADDVADDKFEAAAERLRSYFETILPEKSQFEL